jgi:hypothetical protein
MNDLVNILDGFLKMSQTKFRHKEPNDFKKWKQCVAFQKLGWKAVCKKEDNSDNITVTWKKEGKQDIKIRLSFIEQLLWLDYFEKKEKKDGK